MSSACPVVSLVLEHKKDLLKDSSSENYKGWISGGKMKVFNIFGSIMIREILDNILKRGRERALPFVCLSDRSRCS